MTFARGWWKRRGNRPLNIRRHIQSALNPGRIEPLPPSQPFTALGSHKNRKCYVSCRLYLFKIKPKLCTFCVPFRMQIVCLVRIGVMGFKLCWIIVCVTFLFLLRIRETKWLYSWWVSKIAM